MSAATAVGADAAGGAVAPRTSFSRNETAYRGTRHGARRAAHLAHLAALCWFRCCFPTALLCASLARRGTAESAAFACAALLGLCLERRPRRDGALARGARAALAALCCGLLVAAGVAVALHEGGIGSAAAQRAVEAAGLAGLRRGAGHGGAAALAPEAVAAAASLASWALGRSPALSLPLRRTVLAGSSRWLALGVPVVAAAALRCNAFGLACQLAASAVALGRGLGLAPEASSRAAAAGRLLAGLLLAASVGQLLVVLLFAVPASGLEPPEHVQRLLGVRGHLGAAGQAQFVLAALLAETLFWSLDGAPAGAAPAGRGSRPGDEGVPEAAQPPAAEEAEAGRSPRTPRDGDATPSARVEPYDEQRVHRRRRRALKTKSSVASTVVSQPASFRLPEADAARGSRRAQTLRRARSPERERLVRDGSGLLRRVVRFCGRALGAVVARLCARSVLPVAALLAWPLAWPSLATLPLLLAGLLLAHEPRSSRLLPPGLYGAALAYQVSCALVLYIYNLYGNACGDPTLAAPVAQLWLERIGLVVRREGPHCFQVVSQAATIVALVFATRVASRAGRGEPKLDRGGSSDAQALMRDMVKRYVLLCLRPVTLGLLATVALRSDGTNLFGLGCVVWVVALTACGVTRPYVQTGWDVLRGNATVWYALLWYCGCVATALFCWQVLGTGDIGLVGLKRSEDGSTGALWPWLCLALLAAAQARGQRAGVAQPKAFMVPGYASQSVRVFGIFGLMALMFLIVMLPPPSVASFMMLVLFVAVVAVEQFNPCSPWRMRLLVILGAFGAIQLPLRYALLIVQVRDSVVESIPSDALLLPPWSFLALYDHVGHKVKLCAVACCMIMAGALHRNFNYFQERERLLSDTSGSKMIARYPMLTWALLEVNRWSASILLLVAYFSLLTVNVISRLYIIMVTVLLFKGNKWRDAGALISVCSAFQLLAQYVFRFNFASVTEEQREYWGVQWHSQLLIREVSLLLLGIVMGSVKRAAVYCAQHGQHRLPVGGRAAAVSEGALRREVCAYGAGLAVSLLFCVALFRNTAWSVVYAALVLIFHLSGDGARRLPTRRTLAWLWLMALVLGANLVYRLCVEVWFPPGTITRPSHEIYVNEWVCRPFDGELRVCDGGEGCARGLTQRDRCSTEWLRWLLGGAVAGAGRHDAGDVFMFLVFFPICVMRHTCIKELEAASRRRSSSLSGVSTGASSSRHDGASPDHRAATLGTPREDEQYDRSPSARSDLSRTSVVSMVRMPGGGTRSNSRAGSRATAESRRDAAAAPPRHDPPSRRSSVATALREARSQARLRAREQARNAPEAVYWAGVFMMWLSLLGSVVTERPCAISLIYTVLLVQHVFTVESAHLLRDPFGAGVRALGYVRAFNLLVILFDVVTQCPSVPCAYELDLLPLPGAAVQTTMFTSASQCVALQDAGSSLGRQAEADSWASFVLQVVGFTKVQQGLGGDMQRLWTLLIFAAALIQKAACERWPRELAAALEVKEKGLLSRRQRYEEYLSRWRILDLSRSDTKHKVLLTKLRGLTGHIRELRAVWAQERPALTEREKVRRASADRVLDLCVQSGVHRGDMQHALKRFGCAQGAEIGETQEACVLEYCKDRELYQLGAISTCQLEDRTARLLARCGVEAGAASDLEAPAGAAPPGAADGGREDGGRAVRLALPDRAGSAESVGRALTPAAACSEAGGAEKPAEAPAPAPGADAGVCGPLGEAARGAAAAADKALRQLCGAMINDFLFLRAAPEQAASDRAHAEGCWEQEESADVWQFQLEHSENWPAVLSAWLRGRPCAVYRARDNIDRVYHVLPGGELMCEDDADHTVSQEDFPFRIFRGAGGAWREPLQHHREDNGLPLLACKALASQTLPMLVCAVVVQFLSYMSVAACLNALAVVLSLMAFPHMSPLFWKALQWYNTIVIFVKIMYQFPVFSAPEVLLGPLESSDVRMVPWALVLGIMKVSPDPLDVINPSLTASSLFHALWADLLVMGLLLAHWHALCHGGHTGDPDEICGRLDGASRRPGATDGTLCSESMASVASDGGPRPALSDASSAASAARRDAGLVVEDGRTPLSDAGSVEESEEMEGSDDENWALELVAEAAQEPGRAAVRLSHRLFEAARSMVIGTAAIRKPSMDLYIPRFVLSMALLLMVLLLWNKLQGSGSNFAESVTSSVFDRWQVIAVVVTIVMIVLNRAEYTWYSKHRWYKPLDAEAGTCAETPRSTALSASFHSKADSARRPSEASRAASRHLDADRSLAPDPAPLAGGGAVADASLLIPVLQKALLLLQLVALHAAYMYKWAREDVRNANPSMQSSIANAVFYLVYMAYLSLTSLQLKYDIHMVRGGLNLTHTTDIVSNLMFKAYTAIPFVEELRVLTDWTATKTSLDFFMWMKLEDAQQNLYRVKRDMLVRAWVTPTHPRDWFEKFYSGILLIALLVLLIVAPLMYFSTMNPTLVHSKIYAAKLSISLDIANGDTHRTTVIYEAHQEALKTGLHPVSSSRGVVNVTFPSGSDTDWTMSRSFRTEVEDLLRRTGTTVNFQFFYELSIRTDGVSLSTNPQGSWLARESGGFGSDTQTFNQTAQIILSLDSYMDTFAQFNVSMPQAFYPLMQEDSYGEVKTLQPPQDVTLEFERPSNDDQSAVAELPYWSLRVDGSKPMFEVDYEKTTPPLLGSPGSLTIIGIYATVIYTIGRILRLYFQDRSKFVLYEELPDTQLLLDLCNGIYIARIQGQLVAEYHLYYELIRILRSPELLLEVSQRSRATQLARRGTDLDGGTLGGHGTGRPPSPLPPRLGRSSRSLAAAARTPHGAAGARS